MGIILGFLLLTGLGYMVWQAISKYNPPDELAAYAFRSSYDSLILSNNPARDDAEPLNQGELDFYLGAVDTVWSAWEEFTVVFDSAYADAEEDEEFDPLTFDEVGTVFWHVPLLARRGLVEHLNDNGRSWEEYLSIKQRVVAASDIEHNEAIDSLRSLMRRYRFDMSDKGAAEVPNEELFKRVAELRALGIDSTEQALVAPHRETILTHGVHTLVGTDESFYVE